MLRTLVTQLLALAAILGFQPDPAIMLAIEGIAATAAMLWIRAGVTPVDDPHPDVVAKWKAG